jgi:guanylate kinase
LNDKSFEIRENLFVVVSAPSGAGKTSICKAFLKRHPEVHFSVSYTTRAPRPGEVNGKDYFFISENEFKRKIAEGEFAEWNENYGYLYGTSKKTLELFSKSDQNMIFDLEPNGAMALNKACEGGVYVFVLPPTLDDLMVRLRRRACEVEEAINTRFEKALAEINNIMWYNYIIINNNLDEAVDYLHSIYTAEKSRTERLTNKLNRFLNKGIVS